MPGRPRSRLRSTTTPATWPCCRSRVRCPARSSPACSPKARSPSPGATSCPWSESAPPACSWPAPATPASPSASSSSSPPEHARRIWDLLVEKGAVPCGLGARDTLRLEAGLPLYGHELGTDPDGHEIPLLSSPLAQFAVSFSPVKGDYIGRAALLRQQEAYRRILAGDFSLVADLPRITRPVAVTGRGVARAGARVSRLDGRPAGWVTSGTMVPYWNMTGDKLESHPGDDYELRSICLALLDSDLREDDEVQIDIRGHVVPAVVVPYHLRGDAPPYARPIVYRPPEDRSAAPASRRPPGGGRPAPPRRRQPPLAAGGVHQPHPLRDDALRRWCACSRSPTRPSATPSTASWRPSTRPTSSTTRAPGSSSEVEQALEREMRRFLGATEVETRVISGQMANAALFSALVDYRNRWNRKAEPQPPADGHEQPHRQRRAPERAAHGRAQGLRGRRSPHRQARGGQLPGAARRPVPHRRGRRRWSSSSSIRPELIIFGKSMVLYKEPVADIRRFVDEQGLDTVIMYDMAHVLGLVGPLFQQPFAEGADFVTGSTHKTFFGTQRGRHRHPAARARRRLRAVADGAAPHLPRLGVQPPPGDHAWACSPPRTR